MDIMKAFIMGLVQGIAEFLPISSSGHLIVIDHYLRGTGKAPFWFDILLHIATLIVVIIFFFQEFMILVRGGLKFYKFFSEPESRFFWLIVIAVIFTVIIAILIEPIVVNIADVNYKLVGVFFIINSFILLLPYIIPYSVKVKSIEDISVFQSIFIGIAQGIGVFPGISRSGITISSALIVGFDRNLAGVFSFLLFIPSVIGAFIYESYKYMKVGGEVSLKFEWSYLVGFIVAIVVGYIFLSLLVRFLKEGKLYVFSIYTFILGILVLIF
ncbi:MAG: undecaprenyl-diphosphate phosphatase [Brevinematia bacterium]